MREGDYIYPKSCLEILFRSFNEVNNYPSGIYKIQAQGRVLETYCDLERYGGGWTLVAKASSSGNWTEATVLEHNTENVNSEDYSIFNFVDDIKHVDPAEVRKIITNLSSLLFLLVRRQLLYQCFNISRRSLVHSRDVARNKRPVSHISTKEC